MKKSIKVLSRCGLFLGMLLMVSYGCNKEPSAPPPVIDIEGNTYKTVKIGLSVWMAENLKTTKYNDGSDIPYVTSNSAWGNLGTPGYCWYNNDELTNKEGYGALYNGYTVSTGKLCPTGWHAPSKDEILDMISVQGDSTLAGGKLKEAGFEHWITPNMGADNSSGFKALGAGVRYFEGSFSSITSFTAMWTETEIGPVDEWYFGLYFNDAAVTLNHRSKRHGFSVRCIKDKNDLTF